MMDSYLGPTEQAFQDVDEGSKCSRSRSAVRLGGRLVYSSLIRSQEWLLLRSKLCMYISKTLAR